MTEPTTVNVGIIIPNTGDLPGTWGSAAVNPDFVALDGYLGGVQTISVSNAPVTLTSPSGYTPTPSGGPTQAQNLALTFTGSMTANVQITLSLPGSYIIENLTTGNFVLSFRAIGSGEVIAVDQGEYIRIYCNGTNVRFVNLGRVGHLELWAGLSAMPAWVGACTVPPYLLLDGSVYNFSTYPYLGKRLGSAFGGNGITTFGVPDLRGRVALPYDGTGTRITSAGCGLNGQTIGAALDEQTYPLIAGQIPTITSNNNSQTITVSGPSGHTMIIDATLSSLSAPGGGETFWTGGSSTGSSLFSGSNAISVSSNNTGGASHPNVQPSQVTGIAVIRAA